MKLPKIAKKLRSRRYILVTVVMASILVGGTFYAYKHNELNLQNERTTVAPKEEAQIAREETVESIDSSATTLEQTAKVAAPQPTAAPKSQPPNPLPTYSKKDIKLIQGGTLVPNKASITYYKGQVHPSVTFMTSDGAAVPFPTKHWSDHSVYAIASLTGIPSERRSSWTVYIDAQGMPTGTFKAEAYSTINDSQGNSVQYSGSVTVNVVDSPY